MTLTLYYFPLSPSSRTILSFLDLNGVQYQKKVIDILKGEQNHIEYLKINPQGTVPALQDGNIIISEPEAIIRYLVKIKQVGQKYYPSDSSAKARLARYMVFHQNVLSKEVNHYFLTYYTVILHPTLTKDQIKSLLKEASKRFKEVVKRFQEEILKDKKYIAGDEISFADLFAINELSMISLGTDFDFTKFPEVRHYIERGFNISVINQVNQPVREFVAQVKQPIFPVMQIKKKRSLFGFLRHKKQAVN